MATTEEIERRVGDADTTRTARRVAAAKRVGELARHRTGVAEQLADIEHELGNVLAESVDVIDIEELARFTDVPAADLTQWLNGRKTNRAKRKRPAADVSAAKSASPGAVTPKPPRVAQKPTPRGGRSTDASAVGPTEST